VKFLDWQIPPDFWARLRALKTAALDCFWTESSIMFMFTADLVLVGILLPSETAVYGVLATLFSRLRAFLQTFGEAAWPIIAAKGGQGETISNPLLRLNAWIYGAVLGALLPTLTALTALLTTVQWIPDQTLVRLFIIRNLISGIWSAAGYFMLGMGQFRTLRKYFQREVIADLILASVLGYFYGARGIAAGFLLGTAFGTLFPLMCEYSKCNQRPVWDVLFQVWSRAAVAFLVGWATAATLLPLISHRWMVFGVLALSASVALLPALIWALLQKLRNEKSLLKGLSLRQIVRQC
jgi:O-antigen/teichoic acid export membrane protein